MNTDGTHTRRGLRDPPVHGAPPGLPTPSGLVPLPSPSCYPCERSPWPQRLVLARCRGDTRRMPDGAVSRAGRLPRIHQPRRRLNAMFLRTSARPTGVVLHAFPSAHPRPRPWAWQHRPHSWRLDTASTQRDLRGPLILKGYTRGKQGVAFPTSPPVTGRSAFRAPRVGPKPLTNAPSREGPPSLAYRE